MAYRNIFISSPSKINIRNRQLVVKTTEEYSFPMEDISTVMIENNQSNISVAALSECARNGILVFFCDEKHLPCGIVNGFHTHSRKYKLLQAQIQTKETLKKYLWSKIVIEKIRNQAKVLELASLSGYDQIMSFAQKVKLNDKDNMEAVAAAQYFKYLFGSGFSRGQDTVTNARWNYGYAIIRGLVCRSLTVYGLEPALGIHHHSQLNAFNLADDIMEVFRPVVDLCVYQMQEKERDFLTTEDKQILYHLISCDVLFGTQKHPLFYGVEKTVQTFQSSIVAGEDQLKLCAILPLRQHEYE